MSALHDVLLTLSGGLILGLLVQANVLLRLYTQRQDVRLRSERNALAEETRPRSLREAVYGEEDEEVA